MVENKQPTNGRVNRSTELAGLVYKDQEMQTVLTMTPLIADEKSLSTICLTN